MEREDRVKGCRGNDCGINTDGSRENTSVLSDKINKKLLIKINVFYTYIIVKNL